MTETIVQDSMQRGDQENMAPQVPEKVERSFFNVTPIKTQDILETGESKPHCKKIPETGETKGPQTKNFFVCGPFFFPVLGIFFAMCRPHQLAWALLFISQRRLVVQQTRGPDTCTSTQKRKGLRPLCFIHMAIGLLYKFRIFLTYLTHMP